jgi:multicomponent Na+:H+ antiporter subunit B
VIDVFVALLFLLLMVVCAVAALHVKDLLAAVIIFGAFSFFSAAFFVVQDALDVAFTEAAVGAVITTVFFVCAIRRTTRGVRGIGRTQRGFSPDPLAMLLLLPALVVLLQATADLPQVGDGASAPFTHVAPYYIEHGHEDTGATNYVTAVLADYRGYDTFGELTVIFTAGVACLLIVGDTDDESPPQDTGNA